KNVIVDGLGDCANYPANLPQRLARDCIPDADATPGQCSVSLKLGVNRASCNRVHAGADPQSADVFPLSYAATLKGPNGTLNVTSLFQSSLTTLSYHVEQVTSPVTVALPVSGAVAKY